MSTGRIGKPVATCRTADERALWLAEPVTRPCRDGDYWEKGRPLTERLGQRSTLRAPGSWEVPYVVTA